MVEMKTCTLCGETKSEAKFGRHRAMKDGLSYWCKKCTRKRAKSYRETGNGIYTQIKARSKYYKRHKFNISREDFLMWYNSQPQVCHYCGLPKKHLKTFMQKYGSRWFRLTIDCKDNEAGYIAGNLVLACDKCNSIKSNILSYEDMKYIGETFVKPKWMAFFGEPTTARNQDE